MSAPRFAVGLEVGPADDPIAPEQWQHVVPVPPLRCGLVDLDQVVEAEDAARERPVPEQVVERREQGGRRRPGRVELGAGRHDHRLAAVLDAEAFQQPVGDERVDVGADPGSAAAKPPVLDDSGLRQRTARADGP